MASSPGGLATPPPESFDIVGHYNQLLAADPTTTPPVVAIESLLAFLAQSQVTTISETLDTLRTASNALIASQKNPVPLGAGTELLQRYLLQSFQSTPHIASAADFTLLKRQLIANIKTFVSRTKSARTKIARHALPFIRDDSTVVVYGGSRVVEFCLVHAAEQRRSFSVVFVASGVEHEALHTKQTCTRLNSLGVRTAVIALAVLSHALSSLSHQHVFLLLGAEAILENGAPMSRMGTRVVAEIGRLNGRNCFFVSESFKFSQQYPLRYSDEDLKSMGVRQSSFAFEDGLEVEKGLTASEYHDDDVDITPPELVTGLVTEEGVMSVAGVSEELIKLWF